MISRYTLYKLKYTYEIYVFLTLGMKVPTFWNVVFEFFMSRNLVQKVLFALKSKQK